MAGDELGDVAAFFGESRSFLSAIEKAEGNILRAVQCSIPTIKTRRRALEVTARSANHARRDFIHAKGLDREFVAFWGARWAPVGAENDPTNLNRNWVKNVLRIWLGK